MIVVGIVLLAVGCLLSGIAFGMPGDQGETPLVVAGGAMVGSGAYICIRRVAGTA